MRVVRLTCALLGVLLLGAGPRPPSHRVPERPRRVVPLGSPGVVGRTLQVAAGGDLQRALDVAQPGDVISLAAGGVFPGPFILPTKDGSDWITVRTSAPDSALPPPGTRIDPSFAPLLARLESDSSPVVLTAPGAHHYHLLGLEIQPRPGTHLGDLLRLGSFEPSLGDVPHDILVDRCYLHGDPAEGARRGVALNSAATAIVDSYLSDFKEAGADAQAVAGWNGPGPFTLTDDYLEAAGENVLFGGADPTIPGLVPADITIEGCHLVKPLAWNPRSPSYDGSSWTVKNLFELKNARRVLVRGNVLENNWAGAQNGFSVLFTVRNQDGGAPWVVVEDVTFEDNILRHVAQGFNILGHDSLPSGRTQRLAVQNNVLEDVGAAAFGGGGTLLQILSGVADLTVEHNTAFQTGNILLAEAESNPGFVFRNNIVPHNAYGMIGTATAPGLPTLEAFFPGADVRGNVIVGAPPSELPPGNSGPASFDLVGFVDPASGNYALAPSSPFKGTATDGSDPGADLSRISGPAAPAVAPPPIRPIPPGSRHLLSAHSRASGTSLAKGAFWASVFVLACTFVGYPALLWAWSTLRPRPPRSLPHEPQVSVLVVAQDEEDRVADRLENLLGMDYPAERLEILLASDGSTDRTVERALAFSGRGVSVIAFPGRRGKPAVLNDVVPEARGEIVVLADARQRFDRGALRALVAPFSDTEVGAVSGELILLEGEGVGATPVGMGFYWRYEKFLRRHESRVDSTVGTTGAIYAVRRALFEPLPEDTLLDDVVLPLAIVRKGYRVVFEGAARAYDVPSARGGDEFRRKVRTLAGCFQLFARNPWLLDPRENRLWLQTISHKGLRLLLPVLMVAALASSAWLATAPFYRGVLAGQGLFYMAALAGHVGGTGRHRALAVPYVFVLMGLAAALGFVRFATGRQRVTWGRNGARLERRGAPPPA